MSQKPYLIGVAGGSCSGKSTVVNEFLNSFSQDEIGVLALDHYYNDLSYLCVEDRAKVNFDLPGSLDFELIHRQLRDLKAGNSINRPCYDFSSHTRSKDTQLIEAKPVIIVDGLFCLHDPKILELLNLKIFIAVASDLRLLRRINRDRKERGRELEQVMSQYIGSVRAMHELYIEPSQKNADLIIPHSEVSSPAIEALKALISKKLAKNTSSK